MRRIFAEANIGDDVEIFTHRAANGLNRLLRDALLGIGLGVGLATLVSALSPLPASVAPWSIALGLFLGIGVGITAGAYPAYRAALLDRFEAISVRDDNSRALVRDALAGGQPADPRRQSVGLDRERQRRDVEEQDLLHLAREHAGVQAGKVDAVDRLPRLRVGDVGRDGDGAGLPLP